jgi:predicted transcriptional regulator
MNSAEIKLELFRKIDQLDNNELERVYTLLLKLLNAGASDDTTLSQELKSALDEALIASEKGQVSTHEEVMQKTRDKYSHLFK